MKKIILLLFVTIFTQSIFAWSLVDEIVKIKADLYFYETQIQALEKIGSLFDKIKELDNEEEKLICENMLLVEKLNFSSVEDNADLKKIFFIDMNELSKKNQKYMDENKKVDKWLLVSYSDLLVRLMSYQSSKEMYKISMQTKKYYERALKIDSKFAYAYNSYGLWLYFAPSIAGGGLDVAYKNITKAVKYAADKSEQYLYLLNRSQILYRMKRINEYEKDLKSAHALFEKENFTDKLREMNCNEKILFDN
jgi:ribosomal silencing factor RsfS